MCCHNNVEIRKLNNEEDIKFEYPHDSKKNRVTTEKNDCYELGGNKMLLGKDLLENKVCATLDIYALMNRKKKLAENVNISDYLTLKVRNYN